MPPPTPVCQKDEFQCSNGRCISAVLRCNYFNDCEDYGSDEIQCNMKGVLRCRVLVLAMHLASSATVTSVNLHISLLADNMLSNCRSNRSVCLEGDEAHCVVNGSDSFCSCKPGFQSNGPNRCEGAAFSAPATFSAIYIGRLQAVTCATGVVFHR